MKTLPVARSIAVAASLALLANLAGCTPDPVPVPGPTATNAAGTSSAPATDTAPGPTSSPTETPPTDPATPLATPDQAAPSLDDLAGYPVPALCGNPAGTLQNGILLGTPDTIEEGLTAEVWNSDDTDQTSDLAAVGSAGSGAAIAAVVRCVQGDAYNSVVLADSVVLWDANGAVLGSETLTDLTPGVGTALTFASNAGGFRVRWYAEAASEDRAHATISAEATIGWTGTAVETTDFQRFDGSQQVDRDLTAIASGTMDETAVEGDQRTFLDALAARPTPIAPEASTCIALSAATGQPQPSGDLPAIQCTAPIGGGEELRLVLELFGWNEYYIIGATTDTAGI